MKPILPVFNPADGQRIAELAVDDADSVVIAVARARAAQLAWAAWALGDRLGCLVRLRQAAGRELESLACVTTHETGKPIRLSRNELSGALARIDFLVQEAPAALAGQTAWTEGFLAEQIEHVPLGVVAGISAWNCPWVVGCNVIVPALLAGNAVLYKSSEYASMTGLEIQRLLYQAGVPPGVFQVLVGGSEVGSALLAQEIDGLFFAGTHATGRKIAHGLAGRLIKIQLELGGRDPVYVCDDADAQAAAQSLADAAMYDAGQSRSSVGRIYVHEKVHDSFVAAFVRRVLGHKLGHPMSEETSIGPLTRAAQLPVLEDQVADALDKGALLHIGGKKRLAGPGHWFAPAVLTQVDHRMSLMREESLGPVIGIQAVRDDHEAVRLMNDTRCGLAAASVYTPDEQRARGLLAQVRAGIAYWNCCDRVSPRLPWSGVGDSGVGSTLSKYGIPSFARMKSWHLRRTG